MRRLLCIVTLSCLALAGCEKPPLVRFGGEPPPSPDGPPSSPGGVQNVAPTVDAGGDATLHWTGQSLRLAGTAADDGVPSTSLRLRWTAEPNAAEFDDPASPSTTVRFTSPGTYTLTLMADDGALQTRDSLVVTVKPAVYPAPDLSDADPDRGWWRAAPAEVGMQAAPLLEAETYARQAGGAGLVSRHGRLVHSWGNIDERFDLKSTTKSIGSIALGILIDENRVRIEDRAAAHLPTIGAPPPTNDVTQLQNITLLQLATHTSGFEKTGGYGALLALPGTQWAYSDGGLNWLADTLTTVYADDLQNLFIARVWPVLGINQRDDIQWRLSTAGMRPEPRPNGLEHRELAAGMVANVNAMARVGLLFLRRGEWAEGRRVFSPSFVDLVRTPRPESASTTLLEPAEFPDAHLRYGLLWWTNATGALPNIPRDAFWAWGLRDSLIVVIPSLDLVVARAGPFQAPNPTQRVFGEDEWDASYDVLAPFLDPIVRAVNP